MAEVLEYSLVVLASLLLGGGSVYSLGNYLTQTGTVVRDSHANSVLSAASTALRTGSVRSVVVLLDGNVVACKHGVLSMSPQSHGDNLQLPARCNFSFGPLYGIHRLTFGLASGNLTLEVSG